jgi:F0F1-type ATP synthase assembly protein I
MDNDYNKGKDPAGIGKYPDSQDTEHQTSGLALLAQVTTLSWNLVVPIVGGVLLGSFLDKRAGDQLTWTISLLALGIMVSFGNLYNLYMDHKKQQINNQETRAINEVKDVSEKE